MRAPTSLVPLGTVAPTAQDNRGADTYDRQTYQKPSKGTRPHTVCTVRRRRLLSILQHYIVLAVLSTSLLFHFYLLCVRRKASV